MNESRVVESKDKMNPPDTGKDVAVVIDTKTYEVHRGHTTIIELKNTAGIPLAYELEQVVNGKLVPLPDDGAVTLKGGEHFISHPREGASS